MSPSPLWLFIPSSWIPTPCGKTVTISVRASPTANGNRLARTPGRTNQSISTLRWASQPPATLGDGLIRARARRRGAHRAATRAFFGSPSRAYGKGSGVKVVIFRFLPRSPGIKKFSTFPCGFASGDTGTFTKHSPLPAALRFAASPVFRW